MENEGASIMFLKYAILQWECVIKRPPLLFSLGFRVRDMKADNSLPVVGQSFKELCNLPTSFTLSWSSRVKLDAGWTSVVMFESFQRPSQMSAANCFLTVHFERHSVQTNRVW